LQTTGTGKTLLAQAVAGEASVDCFLACSASDFVELYVGRGASRIRSLFQTVRREAKRNRRGSYWSYFGRKKDSLHDNNRPCSAILFIDELDALAKTRSSLGSNDEREQTLNQLLTEMDGFHQQAKQQEVTIIVMAASNRADVLDPAILRRFDRRVHVGYPDLNGRKAILRVHARRVALVDDDDESSSIDWDALAAQSVRLSGVDLRNAVNEAALLAVRDNNTKVGQVHLGHAIERVKRMKELVASAM
jgi:cell division protease FtsH